MTAPYLSKEHNELRNLYSHLMLEIRNRTDLISAILADAILLPKYAAYEVCYLQFRLICELIALSSLAVHGDIPATRSGRLTRAYQADAILNALEKLHPAFYPKPGRQVIGPDGKVKEVIPITDGFLTKPELLALYHECGDLLHRGTLRTIKPRTAGDFSKINQTCLKIVKLLNHHQIPLSDPNYELFVLMKDKDDGEVHVFLMQKLGPAPPH
jgi:hypothetical protein